MLGSFARCHQGTCGVDGGQGTCLGYSNSGFCSPSHLWRRKLIGHDESFPFKSHTSSFPNPLIPLCPNFPFPDHSYLSVPIAGGAGPWKSLKQALQKTGEQCVEQYYTVHVFLHCMAARLSNHSSHPVWSHSLLDGLRHPKQ